MKCIAVTIVLLFIFYGFTMFTLGRRWETYSIRNQLRQQHHAYSQLNSSEYITIRGTVETQQK